MKTIESLPKVVVAARTPEVAALVRDAVAMLGYGTQMASCAEELVPLSRAVPCPGIIMDTGIPQIPGSKPCVLTTLRFLYALTRRVQGCTPPVVMMIDESSAGGDAAAKMNWAAWVSHRGVVDFMVRPTAAAPWTADPERILRLASYLPIQHPPRNVLRRPLAIAWPGLDSATLTRICEVDVLYEDAWDHLEQARTTQDPVRRKAYMDAWRDCQAEAMTIAGELARSLWEGRQKTCRASV